MKGKVKAAYPCPTLCDPMDHTVRVPGLGFPGGSAGQESTCNARDWVPSLGWKDPLEEGMATHSSTLAWRIPTDRGAWRAAVCGAAESDTTE